MKQYEMFELAFQGREPEGPWARADVTAVFRCGEEEVSVKGFYDGGGRYLVRFYPEKTGLWQWKVTGEVCGEGEEVCVRGDRHGMVRCVDTHFAFDDGTPYIPFGTTVYALASQDDALVEETLSSLREAPFNKVRMCVFPKHYDYNHNEPPLYAFEKKADGAWDTGRPCIAFWHRLEGILRRLSDMDIQVDLILFHPYDRWGFASLPQEGNLAYLDYLLRRLSAWPGIWWSLANEYDLVRGRTLGEWEEIEDYVAANDPFRHPLSCHNCMAFWDFSRKHVTHASLQTKALSEIPRWMETWRKPVIIDECCYEGNLPHFWGSISGEEMVRRFWRCYASGGYCTHGETFLSDDDVLWWARGGKLKGESPRRIAFLRQVMESLPGPLTPKAGGLADVCQRADGDALRGMLEKMPEDMRAFAEAFAESVRRMDVRDRSVHLAQEHTWEAHCGEEAYLIYFDQQCYGEQTLHLPEGGTYRAELIDVWNMTKEMIPGDLSGETRLKLPGKDNLALLVRRVG